MSELESELTDWLQKIITTEEPPAGILAFRFGLDEVEEGYLVYLAGSGIYDEADAEWAAYPPIYLASADLTVAEEIGEWQDMLLAVLRFLGIALRRAPFNHSCFGGETPVSAGFGDGDLYRIK